MFSWVNQSGIAARSYNCGHCGTFVSSNVGYQTSPVFFSLTHEKCEIPICPGCGFPSIFFITPSTGERQIPGVLPCRSIPSLSSDVESLYDQARRCFSIEAYDAVVMLSRKILMHVAVDRGAKENMSFFQYVSFLNDNHYIVPGLKATIDKIRDRGNDANHEIVCFDKDDAEAIIGLTEFLLSSVYDLPSRL